MPRLPARDRLNLAVALVLAVPLTDALPDAIEASRHPGVPGDGFPWILLAWTTAALALWAGMGTGYAAALLLTGGIAASTLTLQDLVCCPPLPWKVVEMLTASTACAAVLALPGRADLGRRVLTRAWMVAVGEIALLGALDWMAGRNALSAEFAQVVRAVHLPGEAVRWMGVGYSTTMSHPNPAWQGLERADLPSLAVVNVIGVVALWSAGAAAHAWLAGRRRRPAESPARRASRDASPAHE